MGFFTPEEAEAIIRAAPDKLKFGLALLFLTGIRPKGEFTRLTFTAFDRKRKTIEIDESTSKIRTRRVLYNLPDNLRDWYDKAKPKRGMVCPMTYRNFRANMAKVCKPLELDWPHDATRHTFATCAFHRGLEWALEIMGHSDSRIFLKRYKGQLDPEDAAKLWAIKP